MKIVIASDHAGFFLKEKIKDFLINENYLVEDVGTHSSVSVDYPEYGFKAIQKLLNGEADRGILICGTGIGMSIIANRFSKIRAALCHEPFSAQMARRHNNANVLVLGGRLIGDGMAVEVVRAFLETEFDGGRHERRINLIDELSKTR
ncbi:ribose 5-phosphate isomerase [Caldimicrobium thiodismutans]|jgi:ribose 5-phosphate isomerase B|uniref:Ribose 5-phosphate isomerase n=1 Tax=Caldimicrobium thiodismutans TaxID=1653476 RepID=A0A0U5AF81_9BACT|nr:ribose 5-phosphate isomerase B [Caldimicrobium thiodismutans]BAU22663.1 ribose 5-phosphate isomerase [Caldimicrobium thiodismutans]